jgi:hypothetical protein
MDLNSYIQLKEAYTQVGKPQELTESVDSIWEEVEAFAHALVEEEGVDLSDMTWDEVREAYLDEQGGNNAMRLQLQKSRAAQPKPAPAASSSFSARRNARRSASPAAQANTNSVGQNIKTTKPAPAQKASPAPTQKASPAPTQKASPAPTQKPAAAPAKDRMAGASKADRMGAWAKANPKLAAAKAKRDSSKGTSATSNPMMKDLAKRMPKPAAPKPAAAKPAAPSFGAGIKAGSMLKKEEFSEFDLILSHLIEQGFGDDEALNLMVNMSEEKRQEILQLDELSKKTMGSYVKKASKDVEKRSYSQGSTDAEDAEIGYPGQTPKDKKIDKRQKGIGRAVGRLTRKEETEQLDELSKGTMGSYVKKAAKDVEKRSYSQGSTDAEDAEIGYPGQTPKDRKIDKRQKGIGRAVKKLTRKEETDSLYQAYLSMMSEEESDKRKDKHLESGGHAAKTDYSKPPATGNTFGKKKPMSDEDRSAAMAKIVAKMKKQGGK